MITVELSAVFPPEVSKFLEGVGVAAGRREIQAYLVGGPVRDVLLGVSGCDLDIMLAQSAIDFVEHLREEWITYFPGLAPPKKVVSFPRYGTAKLLFEEGQSHRIASLDFSTARTESYPCSGGRPEVKPGDLKSDLARRDFSINAMAIGLTEGDIGTLYDFCGGKEDLEQRVLRILHRKSFVDDPARLLRAVRFLTRFSLTMESETKELFSQAIEEDYLERLPRMRLYDEFRKTLSESTAGEILVALDVENLLPQVHPMIEFTEEVLDEIEEIDALSREGTVLLSDGGTYEAWMVKLVLLFLEVPMSEFGQILADFSVPPANKERFMQIRNLFDFDDAF